MIRSQQQPDSKRRTFLISAAAGLGTVVLWPECLRAAGRALPELSFIVVSDTHLGYRDQESAAKQWSITAAEIADAKGDFVLHLGDVVDGGREAQYPVYLETRKVIGKPVHEIPGNHDPQELFEKYIRKPVTMSFDHQWLRVLLLNNAHTDSHDGFISPEQIQWIDDQCSDAARKELMVVVCLHVPVHMNQHPDRGWYVKPDQGQTEFYKTIDRHRDRVLALMHGHFHNGVRGWDDRAPVHEIAFPSALYNQDRNLQQQQAPGYNLPEFRPGFTLVTVSSSGMTLRYKPVGVSETAEKRLDRQ
jgi:calcineurin-like phosphoesterase family protein